METAGVAYALCGGLAVSIYAEPRATGDIDFMMLTKDYETLRTRLKGLGFSIEHPPMEFSKGRVVIQRLTKVEEGGSDHLVLDLILADHEPLKSIFEKRQRLDWAGRPLWIVSREGLIELKRLRNSAQDRADLEKLEGTP